MGGKAKAPMMRWLHLRFVELVQRFGMDVRPGHEYGCFNPLCDSYSRGKTAEAEAMMKNLGLETEHVEVPTEGVALVDRALDQWLQLSGADQAASQYESNEVLQQRAATGHVARQPERPQRPLVDTGAPRAADVAADVLNSKIGATVVASALAQGASAMAVPVRAATLSTGWGVALACLALAAALVVLAAAMVLPSTGAP